MWIVVLGSLISCSLEGCLSLYLWKDIKYHKLCFNTECKCLVRPSKPYSYSKPVSNCTTVNPWMKKDNDISIILWFICLYSFMILTFFCSRWQGSSVVGIILLTEAARKTALAHCVLHSMLSMHLFNFLSPDYSWCRGRVALKGFVLVSLKFNSLTTLCKYATGQPPTT